MPGRVAVVDDEDTVRTLVTAILESRGYEVEAFATYAEALAGLRAQVPDLLVVDVRLPDGCGLDLVGALRCEAERRVPAIVLSGMREERDYVRAFAAGAVDYLAKPFGRDELLARCAVHLARSSAYETPTEVEADLPEKDGLAFGRYRIEKELGRGGYGRVYLAHDMERRGVPVALKVLAPLSSEQPEARMRFIRETYAVSSIRDPHVVAVHDVGCVQGRLYFAMEYVAGESLAQLIRRRGTLGEAEARQVLRGLLQALASIDDAGILHRDVKPENVILRGGDASDPVLIDFGLAKRRFDRGITEADILMGTLAYLSPEVIKGQDPDRRSDLFALGLTIRHALTGEEIFPELRGVDLLCAIAAGPIPDPERELTPEFRAFLARLVETEPRARFASARAALAALDAIEERPAPVELGPTGTRRVASRGRIAAHLDAVSRISTTETGVSPGTP